MRTRPIAKSLAVAAVAAQFMILMASAGPTRAQAPAPQIIQPSGSTGAQADPYAAAFAGLNYTGAQKEAIAKIREDIASRKAVVQKDTRLTDDQKDAMLTGFTRMQYNLIYKELTPEQKKLVSIRMHAGQTQGQGTPKAAPPAR